MSDLTFNKIAGGVLATGLAIFMLRAVTEELFHTEPPEKAAYAIAIPEEVAEAGGAEVELPPDWGTVLPVANIEAGKAVAGKCASCHNFDPGGANGTGPGLYGVVGKKPASHAGYAYSAALTEFGAQQPVWDYQHLYEYLKAPAKYVAGTKMTFVGLKNQEDRIAIIAYLHSLGSTLPIPAPNPAAAAPEAPVVDGAAAEAPGIAPDGATTGSQASEGQAAAGVAVQ
jgi:cytochrome c